MSRTYKTEGIVLKSINYGEADRILTVYTRHHGKVRAIAKGVRRLTSRKGGNLESFNQVTLFFARGKNLDLVPEATALNTFDFLRNNLLRSGLAYYLAELVDRLTPDYQPNQQVYYLLLDSLKKINKLTPLKLVRGFEEALLDELGFGVPEDVRKSKGSLKHYIEQVTEREIQSPKVLKRLG